MNKTKIDRRKAENKSPRFSVWKTIRVGLIKTVFAYHKAITSENLAVSDRAKAVLEKAAFDVSQTETDIHLVLLSVAELGFKRGGRNYQIFQQAFKFGLKLCSPEIGLQLYLNCKDHRLSEDITIAMKPIQHGCEPEMFLLRYSSLSGKQELDCRSGSPGLFSNPQRLIVFML